MSFCARVCVAVDAYIYVHARVGAYKYIVKFKINNIRKPKSVKRTWFFNKAKNIEHLRVGSKPSSEIIVLC